MKAGPFANVTVACCEGGHYPFASADCICGADERVLRGYIRNDACLQPMTPEQRNWCLDEIASVEGHERADYEALNDSDLASSVLHAWVDYCRDLGML